MDNLTDKYIIKITEKDNRLSFEENYTPVVCGNSNYVLKFTFDSTWEKCNRKTAIFVVEGKKFAVDFEGNSVAVPALPNAPYFHVALSSSANGETSLLTTAIRVRLEPTILAEDMSEFDPLKNYLPKLEGMINKLQSGDIEIQHANESEISEYANEAGTADYATVAGSSNTQVDLTNDQSISGVKNFVGDLQINGSSVSNLIENSCFSIGKNLLINPNFAINQRGQTEYNCTGTTVTYTVDRWCGENGIKVVTSNDGVVVSNVSTDGEVKKFKQVCELSANSYKGLSFALSCKIGSTVFAKTTVVPETVTANSDLISINLDASSQTSTNFCKLQVTANGSLAVVFYISSGTVLNLKYVKLEVGNRATTFVPPIYFEELSKCQRYYVKFMTSVNDPYFIGLSNQSYVTCTVYLPAPMRAAPIMTYSGTTLYCGVSENKEITSAVIDACDNDFKIIIVALVCENLANKEIGVWRITVGGHITFDAEIY